MKGRWFFFSFGHWCFSQYTWQKSHFGLYSAVQTELICNILYLDVKDWQPRLTHLVRWMMKITHWTSQEDRLQRDLQCWVGMESKKEKKRSNMKKILSGQQTAAKVMDSGQSKELSHMFQLYSLISSLHFTSELGWGYILCFTDFLCYRQYCFYWKFIFLNNLKMRKELFESIISLKKSIICIFLCMFTGN